MVQVDVFWGYGFGASLAVASGRTLAKTAQPFHTRHGFSTAVFLALFWAPTGMLLLLRHPSWETMQAADSLASIPVFLTLAFGITNVTQGLLGFWVGQKLMAARRYYLANLNWLLGYFGMFFILVYGWDGLGFDRFFYDRDMLAGSPAWTPGAGTGATILGTLGALFRFLVSGVAVTLYEDGLWLLPPFFVLMYRWHAEGLRGEGKRVELARDLPAWIKSYLGAVFGIGLGAAIFCAVVTNYVGAALGVGDHVARALGQIPAETTRHVASYLLGLPLGLAILAATVLKPNGVASRILAPWIGER
ncbi:MAG: hypothetical protein IPK07_17300 [Deltaproteobacteria bacterium]|nr:hypothetical protein [Deltaproteobacteria bacterium]